MWKRKKTGVFSYMESGTSATTIVYPSLESTLLLESGLDSGVPANNFNCQVTCGMGGVKRYIYDGSFWNQDFFTINYENTVSALLVSTYQSGDTFTTLFPIVLPRITLQSTSEDFLKKQESVAYALNLLFSKQGYCIQSKPSGVSYQYEVLTINDFLPILQDTVLPPLLWKVLPQTGQLCLVKNTSYVHPDPTFEIAFSIITLPSDFQGDQSIYSGNVDLTGPTSGWFADGGYVFGFGKWNSKTYLFDDFFANNSSAQNLLRSLDLGDKIAQTLVDWRVMVTALGMSYTIACPERSLSCMATKYYKVKSSSLSRLQRRNITTNVQGGEFSEVIGLYYNTPKTSGTYQDYPVSAPIINFDSHLNGNNIIDLEIKDEWGNSIYPYIANLPTKNYFETTDTIVLTYPPAIYQSLDPFNATNGPNYDCLFPYYLINQTMIVFPALNSSGYTLPMSQLYGAKPSMSISHFIRLIGS